MPSGLFAAFSVGENNAPHLAVALGHADRALKEGLRKRGIDNIRRIVSQHLRHILVEDVTVHLLESQKITFGELRAMSLIERFDDLGE